MMSTALLPPQGKAPRAIVSALALVALLAGGCSSTVGPDVDGDGDGYSVAQGDCNDSEPSIHPGATDVPNDGVDQDCDGKDNVDPQTRDADGDGVTPQDGDCDDRNPSIKPSGVEICGDGVDQDCDGKDQACSDADGDGDGFSPAQGDCNDRDPAIGPGSAEVPYNGVDDDCDPTTSDADVDGDGFTKFGGGDCDDTDATVHPGAKEIPYDGIDQDCSGSDLADLDRDGQLSVKVGGTDCDDENPYVKQGGVEICGDGIDQDCDGKDQPCSDVDKDGDGYSPAQGDCDDDDKSVSPNGVEIPYNGKDDDCDALTPDDDLDNDGFTKVGGGDCDDSDPKRHPGAKEIPYDGIDQDCSGQDLRDVDGDGYDSVKVGGKDCDDLQAKINPGALEIPSNNVDENCDGADHHGPMVTDLALSGVYELGVAANGTHHLLAYRLGNEVFAQRLDAAGTKVGAALKVRSAASSIYDVQVASLGSQWLVVWRERVSSDYQVLAQRVSSGGGLSGGALTLAGGSGNRYDVRVASDGARWAVVWRELVNSVYAVRARLVTSGGVLPLAAQTLSDTSYTCYSPVIAGDPSNQRFLVAWRSDKQKGTSYDVYGRLLGASGPVGNELTLDASPGYTGELTLSYAAGFLLTWTNSSWVTIRGLRLAAAGTPQGAPFVVSNGMLWPWDFVANSCGGKSVVAWIDCRYDTNNCGVVGDELDAQGKLLSGSNANIPLYSGPTWVDRVRLSCLSGVTRLFIVTGDSVVTRTF